MRHIGLIVADMGAEIEFFETLGYQKISHKHEIWAYRRLEICKMSRDGEETLIELVKPATGEWSPHVSIDVASWPNGMVVRNLGEPDDETLEVGFAVSPGGNVVEMVKTKKGGLNG